MKTRIISLILIIAIIIGSTQIYAVTKSELNNQNNDLDNKISQTEDEIDELNSQLSEAMKEVQDLIVQISSYEQAIEELNNQINSVTEQIAETESNIEQKQKELDEKQELLDKRLIALYESGNTSYIELLLSSADLSDFISKYYLISEVAEYDTDLINSIRSAKTELENAKTELENNKMTLETAKVEQQQKQQELEESKKVKEQKVANLTAEEKQMEQKLEEFENDKKDIQAQLAEIARQEEEQRKAAEAKRKAEEAAAAAKNNSSSSSINIGSTSTTSNPSSYGYIFPVAGCSKANIRVLSYPSYKGHTGIDVNINVTGKSVVAVKSGTVVISKAMKNADGSYRSYGEYVVINHHDGTMTLYAHMLSGSRTVSLGQEVSQGQVIGTVGSTGNSTGTHLHFEVRVGGSPINPISYLP